MDEVVLILSDRSDPALDGAGQVVRDREQAARELERGRYHAICIDRSSRDAAASDALWLRRRRNRLPVIALVDTAQVAEAADLLGAGVEEIVVRDAASADSVRNRLTSLRRREPAGGVRAAEHIVANSPAMRVCLELVAKAQRSEATVLLQGETGTGKEVIARAIHDGGLRADAPWVAINCAAFPETLLESELFGYERGAFTGAHRTRAGHFEQAHGGTLFLDEIGETAPGFQAKLLRALQEGVVRALGSTRETPVDVRVIAATNRDLAQCVEAGAFRRDLYYRLNVFPIALPPLRSRSDDIVPLAERCLARFAGQRPPLRIAPDAARLLETAPWPGNVRELENEMARIVASAAGETEVSARMLAPWLRGAAPAIPPDPGAETLVQTLARFEAWVLRRALDRHGGRRIATARALGITREGLYKKMKRLGIE